MFLKLEAKLLWDKYIELHMKYYNDMTNICDKFNKCDRLLNLYSEKYRHINKKQCRLNESLKSLEIREAVSKFSKTQKINRKKQLLNTSRLQIGILDSYIGINKNEDNVQIKFVKIIKKVFSSEKNKSTLSEEKKMLLSYFLTKYHNKITESNHAAENKKKSVNKTTKLVPGLDIKSINESSNEKSKQVKSPERHRKLNSARAYESEKITQKKAKLLDVDTKKKETKSNAKRPSLLDTSSNTIKKQSLNKSHLERQLNMKK